MRRQPHGLEFGDTGSVSGTGLVGRLMDVLSRHMAQREMPGRARLW